MGFKFQSDSINTSAMGVNIDNLSSFKFQSDSINTIVTALIPLGARPLNSNLILLIPLRLQHPDT